MNSVPRSAQHGPAPAGAFDTRVPVLLLRLDRNPFHHGTLGAVRSLGRAGIEVHALLESPRTPAARSRHLHRAYGHPPVPPAPGPPAGEPLAGALRRISERIGRPALLVPLDDLSAVRAPWLAERLPGRFLLPRQPPGLSEEVADKVRLAALCRRLDIAHPRTLVPGSAAEAADAAAELGLPAVAKWSRPWLLPGSGSAAAPRPGAAHRLSSTVLVRSRAEARRLYARSAEAGSRLLLQARLAGRPGGDWFFHGCFTTDGECAAGGAGRKEYAWPPEAGLTAVGRWLPHPQLEDTAARLATALGYRGILDLDFRRDPGTGRYHLLDFNPRPGAQFRLFTDRSGLDVVRALHLDLTGRRLPPRAPAHGRVLRVENYALLAAVATAPRGSRTRPPPAPGPREAEYAWFAGDDPAPFLAMAAAWSRHVLRRGLGRTRHALRAARTPAREAPATRPPADTRTHTHTRTTTQNGEQPCTTS